MYKTINSLGPPTGENGTEPSKSVLLLKERATRGGGGGGGGRAKFQYFFRCLEFLIFLGVMVDARPEPTYEEKLRVPPLVHPKNISGISSTPKKYLKFKQPLKISPILYIVSPILYIDLKKRL